MKSLSLWHAQLLAHCFRATQLEKDRHIVKIDKRIDILNTAISYGKLLYAHNWFLFVSLVTFPYKNSHQFKLQDLLSFDNLTELPGYPP